jgi:hypothetical protein
MIEHSWVYQTLRHWRECLRGPEYRKNAGIARAEFAEFCHHHGGRGLRHNLLPRSVNPKTALLVSLNLPPVAKLEGMAIKAFQMAGFDTVVLGRRRYDLLRYYRLAGAKAVVDWSDFGVHKDPEWVDQALHRLVTLRDWLALTYRGVHVGRFAIASAMRDLKKGRLDVNDPSVRQVLRQYVENSASCTLRGIRLLDHVKPDCALFLDRGYLGQGELFDLALERGIDALTWNGGYKSNLLFFKRYHSGNEREHHASLSTDSWRQICSVPWKPDYSRQVRDELFRCYQSQDWFSSVGTQFGKEILPQQMTRQRLGLSSERKVAVIFPHILWDGSFFWGEDLFDDYTHWFVETMRAACANPRLEWVVKLHPAHVVKARKDNYGRPQELEVIESELPTLPAHVTLIHPDTQLSTYSLFQIADYAITVRGTVGIESALFGIPVVTAGTGRYAGRGFTLDSATREEYLEKLATLETRPRLSAAQVELAERFAYGMLFCRPWNLSSVSLEFERDAVATWKVAVRCRTREEWLSAPDMRQLAGWIADGKVEDMLAGPLPG